MWVASILGTPGTSKITSNTYIRIIKGRRLREQVPLFYGINLENLSLIRTFEATPRR